MSYKIKIERIEEKINGEVVTVFPIHMENTDTPQQLFLLNREETTACYDPVYSMRVEGDELVVVGWLNNEYRHKLSEFTSLEVRLDESALTALED